MFLMTLQISIVNFWKNLYNRLTSFSRGDIMSGYHMRWIVFSDMQEIISIENQCFPFPWDENDFEICLRKKNHVGIAIVERSKIIGYMIFSSEKNAYSVHSIAVDPQFQRKGYGTIMLNYLMIKMRSSASGAKKMNIMVSDQNLFCHNFLKKNNFIANKIHRQYFGPMHDAYQFEIFVETDENNLSEKSILTSSRK